MKRRVVVALAVLALTVSGLLMLSSSASGGLAQKTTVSGNSTPSTCSKGKGAGAITMTGDLEGCLWFLPTKFTCTELNGFARYIEWGTEQFVGKLNGVAGRFATTYRVDATYEQGSCKEFDAGGFPAAKQINGGCQHSVTGRSGAFKGAKGLITFFDVIKPGAGATNYLYSGSLTS